MTTIPIDPLFLEVCEPDSIMVIGLVPNKPSILAGENRYGSLIITQHGAASVVSVTVRGIRRGFAGVRFTPASEEEFNRNREFWSRNQ